MGSTPSAIDLRHLMKAQILFWLLAAPVGHAKNFRIQIMSQARFKLVPLFEVMSIWPMEGPAPQQWSIHKLKIAMAFCGKNKHDQHKDIHKRHLITTAQACGLKRDVNSLLEKIIAQAPQTLAHGHRPISPAPSGPAAPRP